MLCRHKETTYSEAFSVGGEEEDAQTVIHDGKFH